MKREEKVTFLYENINYLLAPYYLINQKSTVVSMNSRKIKKLPEFLLIMISNYLINNEDNELEEYIYKLKNDKEYMIKYQDIIYLALAKQEGYHNKKAKYMLLILNSIKKYLNKDDTDKDKLALLQKYYELVRMMEY